jgi:peroxiredoxin
LRHGRAANTTSTRHAGAGFQPPALGARFGLSLRGFRGRRVVLVFYPADWEPVSREQLALYQEYAPTLKNLRADLLGISTDGIFSHVAFAQECGIRFALLADSHPKGAVARAYGVYLEREESGSRALFVIDERGLIRWSREYPTPVNPGVDGVLCALETMDSAESTTLRQEDEGGCE